MAKITNKTLAVAAFLLFSLPAAADSIRIRCGNDGILESIDTPSGGVEFGSDQRGPIESQVEESCARVGECFSRFAEMQKLVADSAAILAKSGADADLAPLISANEYFQGCKKRNVLGMEGVQIPERIEIRPSAGINRGKKGRYYSDEMAAVVRHALIAGTDPYLALAITMLENPATSKKGDVTYQNYYMQGYGSIPVDETAAYTALGCLPGGRNDLRYLGKKEAKEARDLSVKIAKLEAQMATLTFTMEGGDYPVTTYLGTKRELEAKAKSIAWMQWMQKKKGEDPAHWQNEIEKASKSREELISEAKDYEKFPLVQKYMQIAASADSLRAEQTSLLKNVAEKFSDKAKAERWLAAEANCASSPDCRGVIREPKQPLAFNYALFPDGSADGPRQYCAAGKMATVASSPAMQVPKPGTEQTCCAELTGVPPGQEQKFVTASLGAKYIKDQIQDCVATSKKTISYCIQKYNGLGCLGCSERVGNTCFYKMQMAKTPLYGARAADLMLDALMDHPEVNRMVQFEQRRLGLSPTSIFCLREKAGIKSLDSSTYAQSIRSMLGGRAACRKFLN